MKQLIDYILTLYTEVSCLTHIFVRAFEMPHFRYQLQTWLLYFSEHRFLMPLKEFRRKDVFPSGGHRLLNTYQIAADLSCDFFRALWILQPCWLRSWQVERTLNLEQGIDDHSISQWCKQTDAYKIRCNISRNGLKLLQIRKNSGNKTLRLLLFPFCGSLNVSMVVDTSINAASIFP